jgi:hypothetical protein
MEQQDVYALTAPCGIDCFNCELLESNLTGELRASIAARTGRPPAEVGCHGCRAHGCPLFSEPCPTRACVTDRGIAFCSQCDDFPCLRLLPSPQALGPFPHNMKLYNLCRIQAVGLHRWAEEEASDIRRRYFQGTFKPGHGPVLESS